MEWNLVGELTFLSPEDGSCLKLPPAASRPATLQSVGVGLPDCHVWPAATNLECGQGPRPAPPRPRRLAARQPLNGPHHRPLDCIGAFKNKGRSQFWTPLHVQTSVQLRAALHPNEPGQATQHKKCLASSRIPSEGAATTLLRLRRRTRVLSSTRRTGSHSANELCAAVLESLADSPATAESPSMTTSKKRPTDCTRGKPSMKSTCRAFAPLPRRCGDARAWSEARTPAHTRRKIQRTGRSTSEGRQSRL